MYVLILTILLYKNYTLPLFNNIIDSFKSKVIAINFSITFLQTVEVASFYWFVFRPKTCTNFLITNNQLPHQQFVKKF